MNLKRVIYIDVKEFFGMSGPYIGKLIFLDQLLHNEFVADAEKISEERDKIVFAQYLGQGKNGFLNLFWKRIFKILVYNEKTKSFFQSKTNYEALCIEKMEKDVITFHKAFHTEMNEFRNNIQFNRKDFLEINPPTSLPISQ